MVGFSSDVGLVDAPIKLPSSLVNFSICSLMATARFSWIDVRSSMFIRSVITILGMRNSSVSAMELNNDLDYDYRPDVLSSWKRRYFVDNPVSR